MLNSVYVQHICPITMPCASPMISAIEVNAFFENLDLKTVFVDKIRELFLLFSLFFLSIPLL